MPKGGRKREAKEKGKGSGKQRKKKKHIIQSSCKHVLCNSKGYDIPFLEGPTFLHAHV